MDAALLAALLLVPTLAALATLALGPRAAIRLQLAAALLFAAVAAVAVVRSAAAPLSAAGGWLRVDALSAYHLVLLAGVYLLAAAFATRYFYAEIAAAKLSVAQARQYGALFSSSLAAMALVLVADNLGVMWIGVEATTLLTAFLICVHRTPTSLEAMWKYLLVCSVGIAFAFLGTLFTAAAASKLGLSTSEALLWSRLAPRARELDPSALRMAFLFLVVGYGTKAGLAPMHSWLPDAHSQAPAPVSAIFSGVMLNIALYCLMRYLPLCDGALGPGWARGVLVVLGLVSVVVAGAFIVFQRDAKRLLAYSSVEHMGIVAVGLGVGGLGTFAALFHLLGHSLCKPLAFFSAGRLGQLCGGHRTEDLAGCLRRAPVWGAALLGSVLLLIGVAPGAVFLAELQLVRAALGAGAYVVVGVLLVGLTIVFLGALRQVIEMAWGEPRPGAVFAVEPTPGIVESSLALAPLALAVVLGVWLPEPLVVALDRAAAIVGGGR